MSRNVKKQNQRKEYEKRQRRLVKRRPLSAGLIMSSCRRNSYMLMFPLPLFPVGRSFARGSPTGLVYWLVCGIVW